jgi:acyl-CoA synthetase (AMP-forming)/AMP-acid ligase II
MTNRAVLPLRPGASDDRRAASIGGTAWTYRQFADLVREAATRAAVGPTGPTGPIAATIPMSATGLPIVPALATVFAAAAKGVPVIVGDPAGPVPALGPLPPDTFLVAVTSGTSGRARAVLRTASSWTESFAPFSELTGIGPADRVLLTGPLHATLHLFAAVHTLAIGAELTDRPEDATAVHAVPAVLADLLARLPDSAPLRTAVVAGTALSVEIADRALDRGIAVTEYYGAAELSFVAARRFPEPLREFPGAQVELRDGTLWVRSPYLALGYPAGTTGPFHRGDDGFATVGDLAGPLAGGGLLIRGRGDAAITTGGATVIAEDVEAALATLPGVAAVAVVGVPHARLGQVVTAVIELSPGADLSTLRSGARRLLRGQSLPRRWFRTDRLPRTPGGKIARHTVALAAAAAALAKPAATQNPAPADGSDSPPEDLSGGSLRLRPLP